MTDIWGFLLQTLTISGVATMLLIIKALFKDKLPPKWQFAVWSVLGIFFFIPAGINGRYTLFNWRFVVEFIKLLFGEYSFTRVILPFPHINSAPKTVADWLFLAYFVGIFVCLIKYVASYIRLGILLRKGNSPTGETTSHIREIAEKYNIKTGRIVEVSGLTTAFVFGVFRPVLVMPADKKIDDKVILHELLHLKNKDTLWSMVICFLRCLHWCNPLVNYCANRAINDMESRCDQQVLELLEGEERRDYGHILLSMCNDKFSKTPGSTCINNGGKNIRERIEAIARFKKYPVGMGLVSGCAIISLVFSLIVGVQATSIYSKDNHSYLSVASARSITCTTFEGAFDTYAKAVMKESKIYRIMCAPESMQDELINDNSDWDNRLDGYAESSNYYIYNLEMFDDNIREGLLAFRLVTIPDDMEWEENKFFVAYQKIRAEKENGRWVVTPLSEFSYATTEDSWIYSGISELPAKTYTATAKDFQVDISYQTIYIVDNQKENPNNDAFSSMFSPSWTFNDVPIPNAKFNSAYDNNQVRVTHLGTEDERKDISQIGISTLPVYNEEDKNTELPSATGGTSSGSSSDGTSWGTRSTYEGWGPSLLLSGGGGGGTFSQYFDTDYPKYFVADLYINNELFAQMELCINEEAE